MLKFRIANVSKSIQRKFIFDPTELSKAFKNFFQSTIFRKNRNL